MSAPVSATRDLEVVLREVLADQLADGDVVVDNQDMGFHLGGVFKSLFGTF